MWFSETVVPSIHGETLSRSNTLTGDSYVYDAAGRLQDTGEEPVGKGCTMRIYAYDEESNRTSLTTREPGTEGKCASEGGTVEAHSYDAANRLVDTGVTYDPLGNTTTLPAVDAGGHELTSKYYVDGQVEYQSQNGQENTYYIDSAGRVRKTVSKGSTNVTAISHFAGSGEALTWKDEGEGKYTRLIPGIDGSLCATQTNGETPVLQLHDLRGDIIATAALAETETKLLTTYNSTEFGVPVNGAPPTKYSWLGASGVASELSSGTLISGTVAYVPQLGRALQTEAVTPPDAVPNGLGSGPAYVSQVTAWEITSGNEAAKRHAEEGATEERAAEREAEEKQLQQCREEGGCGVGAASGGIAEEIIESPEESGGEEATASVSRRRSDYGCYANDSVNYSEYSGFGLIFNYALRLEANWCGYASGKITSHRVQCKSIAGWGWVVSKRSCTLAFNETMTQAMLRSTVTFEFLRSLSLSIVTIYCSMRFTASGYSKGACKQIIDAEG